MKCVNNATYLQIRLKRMAENCSNCTMIYHCHNAFNGTENGSQVTVATNVKYLRLFLL